MVWKLSDTRKSRRVFSTPDNRQYVNPARYDVQIVPIRVLVAGRLAQRLRVSDFDERLPASAAKPIAPPDTCRKLRRVNLLLAMGNPPWRGHVVGMVGKTELR